MHMRFIKGKTGNTYLSRNVLNFEEELLAIYGYK